MEVAYLNGWISSEDRSIHLPPVQKDLSFVSETSICLVWGAGAEVEEMYTLFLNRGTGNESGKKCSINPE